MRKIYSLSFIALFISASVFATTYPGNGNSGFGGAVGGSSLDVTSDGTNITFKLTKGAGDMNDVVVIYFDTKDGGFATTATFADAADGLRKAISGYTEFDNNGGSGRAAFNFNSDFTPEYALAFQAYQNGYTGVSLLVELNETSHVFISNPDFQHNDSTTYADYTVSFPASAIGLTSVNFKFLATYISPTGYRSNEAIGDPMTNFSQGWNEYTSASSPLVYDATMPVVFGSFTGVYKNNSVVLNWSTKTESNTKQFIIQKSSNGATWNNAASVYTKNRSSGANYSYTDLHATDAKTYYRLQLVNLDGTSEYSYAIIVRKASTKTIDLMGNPVKGAIKLSISNDAATAYQFELFTSDGKKVLSQMYHHAGGTSQLSMNVPPAVKGVCILRITNGDETSTMKIYVQ